MLEDLDAQLRRDAARARFDRALLAAPDETSDDTELLLGCLWSASEGLVRNLLQDVRSLHECEDEVAWSQVAVDSLSLSGLPRGALLLMTPHLAEKFLVAGVDLTSRLTRGWSPASCVAQELLVHCWLDLVEELIDSHDVPVGDGWRDRLERALLEDSDHRVLYGDAFDAPATAAGARNGGLHLSFGDWFVPFGPDNRLPPFAEDPDDAQGQARRDAFGPTFLGEAPGQGSPGLRIVT